MVTVLRVATPRIGNQECRALSDSSFLRHSSDKMAIGRCQLECGFRAH